MLTEHERVFLLGLLEREPREVLSLFAGQALNIGSGDIGRRPGTTRQNPIHDERRPGDDPFLIDEDEFSYRARHMSHDEQRVLRCKVNAARAHKAGHIDDARRFRQQADRLERKLSTQGG